MSKLMEALRGWGCDVDGTMERMAGDEAFYRECLQEVAEDSCFPKLKTALETGDVQTAFEAAHTLKGVLANVGLTPMYRQVVEIVEPLRAGHGEGLTGQYERLEQTRAQLKTILHEG